MLSVNTVFVAN